MSDREEIRWKLSNVQQITASAKEEHEKEQENFQRLWIDIQEQAIRGRNTLVGGIGFGILLVISLISIDKLSDDFVIAVPIAIVVALIIYVGINLLVKWQGDKYNKLDNEYREQILELIEYEGWFIGISLREDITVENIALLIHFTRAYTQTVSYDISNAAHKIFKEKKPDPLEFKASYDEIKPHLEEWKKFNLKAVTRVEKFYNSLEPKATIGKTT